jgi:hypothetical protein
LRTNILNGLASPSLERYRPFRIIGESIVGTDPES